MFMGRTPIVHFTVDQMKTKSAGVICENGRKFCAGASPGAFCIKSNVHSYKSVGSLALFGTLRSSGPFALGSASTRRTCRAFELPELSTRRTCRAFEIPELSSSQNVVLAVLSTFPSSPSVVPAVLSKFPSSRAL